MSNSLGLSQLLQHNLPKPQAWTGCSGQCGYIGTKQISSDRDALSVTDCSPLHFCSLLLVSLIFQTFKIANLEHVGVFFLSLLKQVLFFFFLKKLSSLDFIAAVLKQYTKNKKRESIQISGFFPNQRSFHHFKKYTLLPSNENSSILFAHKIQMQGHRVSYHK